MTAPASRPGPSFVCWQHYQTFSFAPCAGQGRFKLMGLLGTTENTMRRFRLLPLALLLLASTSGLGQISLGKTNDFQDGTVMGWTGNFAFPTQNIATGGPAGAGDRYLQLSVTNSHLAAFNTGWNGNYQSNQVNIIEADLRNTGATDLHIRIVLFGTNGDRWTSTTPVVIPAGSNWQHVSFSLDEGALTRVLGTGSYQDVITSAERLMFRHDTDPPSAGGENVTGTLGIDNVRASSSPQV